MIIIGISQYDDEPSSPEITKSKRHERYDGLIVCVSCHGLKNTIITSDFKEIEKDALHRLVSLAYPQIRDIIRVFVVDACNGLSERRATIHQSWKFSPNLNTTVLSITKEVGPGNPLYTLRRRRRSRHVDASEDDTLIENEEKKSDIVQKWTTSTKNPDYNLAVICSANSGFMAKSSGAHGSYYIHHFIKRVREGINGGNSNRRRHDRSLSDIHEEIEMMLHWQGSQLPAATFHAPNTRNIVFERNVNRE